MTTSARASTHHKLVEGYGFNFRLAGKVKRGVVRVVDWERRQMSSEKLRISGPAMRIPLCVVFNLGHA